MGINPKAAYQGTAAEILIGFLAFYAFVFDKKKEAIDISCRLSRPTCLSEVDL